MNRLLFTAILATAMGTSVRTSELASLRGATAWINSPPLTAESLRGKVVLVQFWTYSCVNWIRTLSYARAWAEKYRDKGLVVIGVHTPEFGFEHDLANVRWSATHFRVGYPVAVDNDYAIWRGFANQYWPALYLMDGQGRVRYRHFGEGEYDRSEKMVQALLAETGARDVPRELVSVVPGGAELAADRENLESPETGHEQRCSRGLVRSRGRTRCSATCRMPALSWHRAAS